MKDPLAYQLGHRGLGHVSDGANRSDFKRGTGTNAFVNPQTVLTHSASTTLGNRVPEIHCAVMDISGSMPDCLKCFNRSNG